MNIDIVKKIRPDPELRKRFGEFLVDRNIVPAEILVKALDHQQKIKKPLGKIAYDQKLLTMEQIFQVLNQQKSNKKFGETAIDLGFLTNIQVKSLLQKQQDLCPKLGETLVEMNKIDQSTLNNQLDDYLKR